MTTGSWHDVSLVAIDIGNSRVKLAGYRAEALASQVPEASVTSALNTSSPQLDSLHEKLPAEPLRWVVSSVHRPAAKQMAQWIADQRPTDRWELLTHEQLPLEVEVEHPERVGMDRLMVALAVNHLREKSQGALAIAIGTAITVNHLTAEGRFVGGAILPGIYLAAEALAGKTDALPLVTRSLAEEPPAACGRGTQQAIASGLYWGAVGAVRELIAQMGEGTVPPGNLFFTGGDGQQLAAAIDSRAVYRDDLVLLGVALAARC